MSTYWNVVNWVEEHPEVVLDLVRIYLGIGLFVRGLLFIGETQGVEALVDLSQFSLASAALVHYVTFAHLLGGLMLAAGLLTRLAALLQIPILMGAVFFVHLEEGLLATNQSLEFSALVLFLLILVFVFGPGRWSADRYVFEREPELHADREPEKWWRDESFDARRPVADSSEGDGGIAVASPPQTQSKKALADRIDSRTCECGHDVGHPRTVVEPHYGWGAGFFFMLGISASVKEVVIYCEECGTILKRTRDPEILRQYRWHTS